MTSNDLIISPSSFKQRSQEMANVIRFLYGQGWCPATSSNFSFRLDTDVQSGFYVSTSGLDKGDFQPEHFMAVNAEGLPTGADAECRPSAETLLHALIYRRVADARVVLHTHSINTVVLSKLLASAHQVVFSDDEILKGLTGINTHDTSVTVPIYPNSQDMAFLARRIDYDWDQQAITHGFILRGHGLYTWGTTPVEAKRHIEVLEYLSQATLKLAQLRR